jgi:aerobic-type carbon monoxide dehydrogenase small subunit (CoxS/CutS family)
MILTINGRKREVDVVAGASLLSVLRNDLELTGTKYGCGEGACGACTVHIAGKPVHSCVTPVASVADRPIVTIEGLEKNGVLHPVQQAFLDFDPFQCSYCAPGMVMSAVALLKLNSSPSEEEIVTAMNGNICRCGTYLNIIKAVKQAADLMKNSK